MANSVIKELRQRGWDVLSVKESMCGADESAILNRAESEQRLVVTQDKDFGELAFKYRLPSLCGVILFRLSGANPASDNKRILEAIISRSDWAGHFSVVTDDRIRMRSLPVGGSPPDPQ
jgi:predicted nuclease of predicted toxin-antitoxin system